MARIKAKIALTVGAAALLAAGAVTVALKTIPAHKAQPDIQGAWEAVLEPASGVKIRVVLRLSATNGSYRATIDNIDQRVKDISINNFIYDYPSVEFESREVGGAYAGKLDAGASEMSGACAWKQSGLTTPLVWKRTVAPDTVPELLTESDYAARPGSALQGYWTGTLAAGTNSVRLAFKIAERPDGKFVAEMDSLNRRAKNLVVSSVAYDKPKVRLEVGLLGAVFEGKLNSGGAEVIGTWTHGRSQTPLILERVPPP
jgi:hypothetical protein